MSFSSGQQLPTMMDVTNSCFEKGRKRQKKCMRQSWKVLWVVLSSRCFKEIWKNGMRGHVLMLILQVLKESNKSRFDSYRVRNSVWSYPILPFGIFPTTFLEIAVCCVRLPTLLKVVACCWELFRKVWNQSNVWATATPKIYFVPWSPRGSATMLVPFAPLFRYCWGHARALHMVLLEIASLMGCISFRRCTAGPNIVGSCCTLFCTPLSLSLSLLHQLSTLLAQQCWEFKKSLCHPATV